MASLLTQDSVMNCLILVAQFWTGFAPVGYKDDTTGELVENFFEVYLAAPIVILFFVVFKFWKKTKFKKIQDIDVTSGRREMNLAELMAEERAEQAKWPKWKKYYKFFC
jgi:amino acid transporter